MSHLAASKEVSRDGPTLAGLDRTDSSALVILFLAMDAGMKIAALPIVTESAVMIGWTANHGSGRWVCCFLRSRPLCLAANRNTRRDLFTGFLGGAVATHLRMGDPLFSHTLFGLYLGIALWGGLWLRDARVRNLLPIG